MLCGAWFVGGGLFEDGASRRRAHASSDHDGDVGDVDDISCRHTLVENMSLERLMALFRKASTCKDHRLMFSERMISAGTMAQVLQTHRDAGGCDHIGMTRRDCVADGVPTVVARRRQFRVGGVKNRGAIEFVNERRALRKRLVGPLSREEGVQESKELGEVYKTLSLAEKQTYIDRARPQRATLDLVERDHKLDEDLYEQRVGQRLWHSSSLKEPLQGDVVEQDLPRCNSDERDDGYDDEEIMLAMLGVVLHGAHSCGSGA